LGRFECGLKGMMGRQGWSRLTLTYPVAPPLLTSMHQSRSRTRTYPMELPFAS
jgi:hypothetical protein